MLFEPYILFSGRAAFFLRVAFVPLAGVIINSAGARGALARAAEPGRLRTSAACERGRYRRLDVRLQACFMNNAGRKS